MLENALPPDVRAKYLTLAEWALIFGVSERRVKTWARSWAHNPSVKVRCCFELKVHPWNLWPRLKLHVDDVLVALPTVGMEIPPDMQRDILSRLEEWGGRTDVRFLDPGRRERR